MGTAGAFPAIELFGHPLAGLAGWIHSLPFCFSCPFLSSVAPAGPRGPRLNITSESTCYPPSNAFKYEIEVDVQYPHSLQDEMTRCCKHACCTMILPSNYDFTWLANQLIMQDPVVIEFSRHQIRFSGPQSRWNRDPCLWVRSEQSRWRPWLGVRSAEPWGALFVLLIITTKQVYLIHKCP